MLRQVEIREVRRRWARNPEHEFDLVVLAPGDRERVDRWLCDRNIDFGHIVETGRPMTSCRKNFVILRVALHLSGRLPEELALRSVRSAIRRDVDWFAKGPNSRRDCPPGTASRSTKEARREARRARSPSSRWTSLC